MISARESGCPCEADFDSSGGTPDAVDIQFFVDACFAGSDIADIACSGDIPDDVDVIALFGQWLAGGS